MAKPGPLSRGNVELVGEARGVFRLPAAEPTTDSERLIYVMHRGIAMQLLRAPPATDHGTFNGAASQLTLPPSMMIRLRGSVRGQYIWQGHHRDSPRDT